MMMFADIGDWLWLVLIGVGLLSKLFGGKKEQEAPNAKPQEKKLSFDDLLREIQGRKADLPPEPVVEEERYAEEEHYYEETEYADEEETVEGRDEEIFKKYTEAQRQIFEPAGSLASARGEQKPMTDAHFNEYELKKKSSQAATYAKELKNPGSVKRAIVLSEILKRPQF